MARSYTIVAIPSRDDYVWNISSEKVPHLTILFLGEQLGNVNRVSEFVDHVVDTSLSKFSLDVDSRGVLGDQSADVLFFNKRRTKTLSDVRTYLLGNTDILKAYSSVEQFPSWTPHLTLGYPETPAKPDKREYPGTHSVAFDRIALWTGDYEGIEFPLKNNDLDEMRMSVSRGASFIQHSGVKGMKWGVRKASSSFGAPASADSQHATDVQRKINVGGTKSLSNKDLQDLITRMNLEQQYSRLHNSQPTAFDKGKKFINNATFVGQTINNAIAFSKSPAGLIVRKSLVGI